MENENFDFTELQNWVTDGLDTMIAAQVVVNVMAKLMDTEAEVDTKFSEAIDIVRAYGDKRVMDNLGEK